MNVNKIIILNFLIFTLYSCADYKTSGKVDRSEKTYFSSNGFALIYENEHYEKKIINKKINIDGGIYVMHNFLRKNTPIRITNPENSKSILTKIYKTAEYPQIFNIVISEEIAEILELDENNPFVEIMEIKKNKTFVAKKSNTFDEEKKVAEKAPVEEITMNELSNVENKTQTKTNKKSSFYLIIGDFYYEESANNLKTQLLKDVKTDKFSINKINKNSYRLALGPFKNFKALKLSYISLNNLGFDNLDIYKE